jgi:hypothetical protein
LFCFIIFDIIRLLSIHAIDPRLHFKFAIVVHIFGHQLCRSIQSSCLLPACFPVYPTVFDTVVVVNKRFNPSIRIVHIDSLINYRDPNTPSAYAPPIPHPTAVPTRYSTAAFYHWLRRVRDIPVVVQ